ncbi:MAG: hypothetical protein JSU68_12435, partial [Phycisphaerales bacterium]
MVAPFWADVDTRDGLGAVWYKLVDSTLIVTWESVGYFSVHGDKRNTFQVALSDGTDPVIGLTKNVAFSYGDMQWTTGDASDGTGGFGGSPATAGANHGGGTDFFQIGRFDHPGDDYDGPGGNTDGVDFLDFQIFRFDAATGNANLAPFAAGLPPDATLRVNAAVGDTAALDLQFLSPELGQTTTVSVADPDGAVAAGLLISSTPGNIAVVTLSWAPDCQNFGAYDLEFTATDDFEPPAETVVPLTIIVDCYSADCNENGVPDECEIGEAPAHNCCQTDHGAGCNDPDIEACVCAADAYCCNGEWDSDCVATVDNLDCGTCVIAGDCNGNGLPDACDVSEGISPDCNGNDLPDDCDIVLCPSDTFSCQDCNGNGVPDGCDLAGETSDDCNANGRPDECDAEITAISLAQESAPEESDFDDHVLGFVEPFETTLSAADFYRYNLGSAASFNGPSPVLTFERSHLFLVQATDGLSLFVVHDRPSNADGGSANTRYELSGDAEGVYRSVEDDPGEGYGGGAGATVFTANHAWSECCTDGLALTGFDGTWSLTMEFTSAVSGMSSWAAYSPDQDPIMLALVPGRRVQLQVVTDPGVADCNDNGVLDTCDIAGDTSDDCQPDGIPDECQLVENDCNGDGVPDDCQLADNDCNENSIPDDCDLATCTAETPWCDDCNDNGVLDTCDIAADTSTDVNANGIPDECEPDCNNNGIPDTMDDPTILYFVSISGYDFMSWDLDAPTAQDMHMPGLSGALLRSFSVWYGNNSYSPVPMTVRFYENDVDNATFPSSGGLLAEYVGFGMMEPDAYNPRMLAFEPDQPIYIPPDLWIEVSVGGAWGPFLPLSFNPPDPGQSSGLLYDVDGSDYFDTDIVGPMPVKLDGVACPPDRNDTGIPDVE